MCAVAMICRGRHDVLRRSAESMSVVRARQFVNVLLQVMQRVFHRGQHLVNVKRVAINMSAVRVMRDVSDEVLQVMEFPIQGVDVRPNVWQAVVMMDHFVNVGGETKDFVRIGQQVLEVAGVTIVES